MNTRDTNSNKGTALSLLYIYSSPPLTKCHSSYQTRFQMHWDSKILVNCHPQERLPLVRQFFHCRRGGLITFQITSAGMWLQKGKMNWAAPSFSFNWLQMTYPMQIHIFFQCWNTRHIWLTCLNFWMVNDFNDSGQSFIPFSTMTCAPVFRNCSTNLSSVKSVTRSSFSILLHNWN